MLLPETFSAALAMMLVSMLCWGSWTNTFRLTRKWRLEFYYCDYALGVFFLALLAAATGGTLFGKPDVWANLREADGTAWAAAALGGACLNFGNFLLMAGIARVGMTVAFPVSVGFALVVSTILNYLVRPQGDPVLLGIGVALVFCAVLTNSLAFRSAGPRPAMQGSRAGFVMCFVAGMLFSICSPLVAKALATPHPLSTYGASLLYASGCLAALVPLMFVMSRRSALPFAEYAAGTVRNHAAGFAGGMIWSTGMVLSFLAAGLTGMAIASAIGQANPLVAALWGIVVWKEFRGASGRTQLLLVLTMVLYATGLVVLGNSFRAA